MFNDVPRLSTFSKVLLPKGQLYSVVDKGQIINIYLAAMGLLEYDSESWQLRDLKWSGFDSIPVSHKSCHLICQLPSYELMSSLPCQPWGSGTGMNADHEVLKEDSPEGVLVSCGYYYYDYSLFSLVVVIRSHMRVSINGGYPIAGCFMMENPFNMEDLGVSPAKETSIEWLTRLTTLFRCKFMYLCVLWVKHHMLNLRIAPSSSGHA